ncbi:sugar ABC transporter substrate-binding protein [Psychromonas sp. psych-6C06]|uniref:SLBB domain-containing protein n=1 Tax=Psychromonas sp. psych-6C06 TaxID=2058089 RepID=UPI000C331179|nr:SLBB domain-containing protein [Psychromonas sp. psych-6C06]PKF62494.1 sugar ABC transporter substrate-binding protein [Psychromonas sp. psych-6C06]
MNILNLKRYFALLILFTSSMIVSANSIEYQIQNGDLLQISLPGEVALAQPFQVDREGRIILPEVGAMQVSGLTIAAMTRQVSDKLKQVYLDIDNLNIYLLKKQLIINVRGYVVEPGEFTLQSDASIQLAIYAAGGLRKGAQLDRLQLIRNKKTTVFNYKQYLDSGDSSLLPTLQSMDSLFIPASPMTGNVEVEYNPSELTNAGDSENNSSAIKVFGEVNHPGSFAYKESMDIVDLLMGSGGVTRYAGVEKIRVITDGKPTLFNLKKYLDSGDQQHLPAIQQGATIFVPKQEEEIKSGANMVYVMGEVAKPGAYESTKGATFMDILANAGGPTRFAESRQIRIIKADNSIIAFDLSAYTEGRIKNIPTISAGDAIFVPEKTDMNEKSWLKVTPNRAVRVLGSVVKPGRIEWSDEMSLLDLLAHVGGPTPEADTANIEIVVPQSNGSTQVHNFNLNAFLKEGQSDKQLPVIKAGSTIMLQQLPQDPSDNKSQWVRQSSQKSIYIFGQVGAPGRYMFTNEMNFLDILAAADGPTEQADLRNIRINHRDDMRKGVSKLDLALYFETGDDHLLPNVRTGDTIYIPEKNRIWLDKSKESTVRVLGAVNKPGRYRFDDTMTLLDLLAESGGTVEDAFIENITVVNMSCCRDQARRFDLKEFTHTAAFSDLPVLRAGDTIYIPYRSESGYEKFRKGLTDVVQIVALGALIGLL